MPVPQGRVQIAPRAARARNPQYRLDKHPVILGGESTVGRLARQQVLDSFPLVLTQQLPWHFLRLAKSQNVPISINCVQALVLVATNREGYGDISALITRARRRVVSGATAPRWQILARRTDYRHRSAVPVRIGLEPSSCCDFYRS